MNIEALGTRGLNEFARFLVFPPDVLAGARKCGQRDAQEGAESAQNACRAKKNPAGIGFQVGYSRSARDAERRIRLSYGDTEKLYLASSR